MQHKASFKNTLARWQLGLFSLLLIACPLDPVHQSPRDALFEPPGKVLPQYKASLRILAQQPIPEGVSLLYRWQTDQAADAGTYCIAATLVTYNSNQGWKAQTTGYLVGNTVSQPACNIANPITLRVSFYRGGTRTAITTVYGITDSGTNVRIVWDDGQNIMVPVQHQAFLLSRQGELSVRRVEVLDNDGTVQAKEVW